MKYLFVGGQKHGQWLDVPDNRDVWLLLEETELDWAEDYTRGMEAVLDKHTAKLLKYTKQTFTVQRQRYWVFVLEGHELVCD